MRSDLRPAILVCCIAFASQCAAAAELTPRVTVDDAQMVLDAALQEAEWLEAPGGSIAFADAEGAQ